MCDGSSFCGLSSEGIRRWQLVRLTTSQRYVWLDPSYIIWGLDLTNVAIGKHNYYYHYHYYYYSYHSISFPSPLAQVVSGSKRLLWGWHGMAWDRMAWDGMGWSMEYEVWSMEYGVWSVEYGVWSLEYEVWVYTFKYSIDQ